MKEKNVLITGSTKGIGRAAAVALARLGASVTIHGRDAGAAAAVADEIRTLTGNTQVDSLAFDLSSLKAVREAARAYGAAHPTLDVLAVNAGVFLPQRELSADGFEKTLATRFLGHFLLTQTLLPSLQASGDGRVVITAAPPNGFAVDWDNLALVKGYSAFKAVMQAMGALLMFNLGLAERMRGQGVTVNFFHPGVINTKVLNQMPWIMRTAHHLLGAPAEKGADTLVYLASDPALKGVTGQFFKKRVSKPFKGAITDPANQARALAEGIKMTGLG